jgi:integrase
MEEEIVSTNPAKDPSKIFKVDSPFRGDYLRPEEVPAYLDGVKKKTARHQALFRTMIFTGPRIGEAIGLEWGDIDWRSPHLPAIILARARDEPENRLLDPAGPAEQGDDRGSEGASPGDRRGVPRGRPLHA